MLYICLAVLAAIEAGLAFAADHRIGFTVGLFSTSWAVFVLKDWWPFKTGRAPMAYGMLGYVCLLTLVRLYMIRDDPRYKESGFPENVTKPQGTVRLVQDEDIFGENHNSVGLEVPSLDGVSVEKVALQVLAWIKQQDSSRIKAAYEFEKENCTGHILHAEFVTTWMGFVDQMKVAVYHIKPTTSSKVKEGGQTVPRLAVQSELRLGVSDLGVNRQRVKALLKYLYPESD